MNPDEDLAPAVRSILASARRRPPPSTPVDVDAQSLPAALARARARDRIPVIAEYKPTSPTTDGTVDGDPVAYARAMVDGGAAALSVLTEPDHFGGDPETLAAIRDNVSVPVLRKDFILEPAQLDAVGADVVLVIARFVDDLEALVTAARDRGMQPLVEVHTPTEFTAAVEAGATLIGVNNRDLRSLSVSLDTFESVQEAVSVPDDVTLIAESGLSTPADVTRMVTAGADGMLIGSAIMDTTPTAVSRRTDQLTTPHKLHHHGNER